MLISNVLPRMHAPSWGRHFWGVVVGLALFASFFGNAFGIAGPDSGSEDHVVGGVERMRECSSCKLPRLGGYEAPDADSDRLRGSGFLEPRDRRGYFRPYRSQFGAQASLWYAFAASGAPWRLMHAVNCALLAAVLAGIFATIASTGAVAPALAFATSLGLSPWIVKLSGNLYWMEWSWFAPTLVVAALGNRVLEGRGRGALALYGATVTAKFLCGYEFASTVVLASLVPLLVHAHLRDSRRGGVLRAACTLGAVAAAGFLVAACMQIAREQMDGHDGFREFALVAEKRLYSSSPDRVAVASCQDQPAAAMATCTSMYARSLRAPVWQVVWQRSSIQEIFPWVAQLRARTTMARPSGHALVRIAIFEAWLHAETLLLAALIGAISIRAIHRRRTIGLGYLEGALALAFLSSLSWFVLAKSHAFLHPMTTVAWDVLFLPTGAAYLFICTTQWPPHGAEARAITTPVDRAPGSQLLV